LNPRKYSTQEDNREKIYKVAAGLFARKGYHGTSSRDIAAAAGLNVSTVNYHVGGKEDLYREILRRTYVMEYEMFSAKLQSMDVMAVKDVNALKDLLKSMMSMFLQRILVEPDTYRLWAFHYLTETGELSEMEREFSLPIYQMILSFMQRARQSNLIRGDDEYLKMLITGISWLFNGYFNGRKNNWGNPNYNPFEPENVKQFESFFCLYIDRMIDYAL